MPRVLVVGTGSIGRRHVRNLVAMGMDVCAYRYRMSSMPAEPLPTGVSLLAELDDESLSAFDAVVVANRTDLHLPVALKAARCGAALFIEKPLAVSLSNTAELLAIVDRRQLVVEAGFMLRLHPNLQWIKRFLLEDGLGPLHYMRACVGQFLPDWRAGTDHRSGYSARRAWGGGVIFDLVHELDLVGWLGGEVEEVVAMVRHVPSLEIETEAIAQVGLRLGGGLLAQVHLDYVRPDFSRTLEVVGSKGSLVWDYRKGHVVLTASASGPAVVHRVPAEFDRNDMFCAHMGHFVERVKGSGAQPVSSLEEATETLRVALACHAAAHERRSVRPSDVDVDYQVQG